MTTRLSIVAVALLGIGFGQPVFAQEARPATGAAPTSSCEALEPRDAAYFADLAGSSAATPAQDGEAQPATGATPVSAELTEGELADDATVAEVTGLYETLIDCLNRGDYLRAYALYSDDYLLTNLSEDILGDLEATPTPVDESTQSEFGGVLEARVLDDGRFQALVTTSNPLSGDVIIKSTLTREDEGLRIAEEVVVEAATPATPEG